MFLYILQELPTAPSANDTKDVESILLYFIGLLFTILIILFPFAILQINKRFTEKNEIIAALRKSVSDLQLKLDKELEYTKSLSGSTSQVLADNTNVLKSIVKSSDKLGTEVPQIKMVVDSNNEIAKEIKSHVSPK